MNGRKTVAITLAFYILAKTLTIVAMGVTIGLFVTLAEGICWVLYQTVRACIAVHIGSIWLYNAFKDERTRIKKSALELMLAIRNLQREGGQQ